jgi:hypothetical protein
MRKRTLAGMCVLLSCVVLIVMSLVGLSVPFGLSPLFVAFVLFPILMAPLALLNKRLLTWRKARGRDIEDEERYEDDASGIISLRPRG